MGQRESEHAIVGSSVNAFRARACETNSETNRQKKTEGEYVATETKKIGCGSKRD